jgi:hypothetical protein
MMQKNILFSCATFAPTLEEHFVILTSVFLPYFAYDLRNNCVIITFKVSFEKRNGQDEHKDKDNEISKLAMDLAFSWQFLNQSELAQVFYDYANGRFHFHHHVEEENQQQQQQ